MSRPITLLFIPLLLGQVSAEPLDFYKDIYPFLKANCISCHNKTTTKGDLDMETPESMIKGGSSGPAIVPGKGADSLLVLASKHLEDMEMPPANNKSGAINLTDKEIALLTQWIDQGAKSSEQQQRLVEWKPLAENVQPIYAVALSKDGRFAACGRGNKIFVYDLIGKKLLGELKDPELQDVGAHRAVVQSLAFSPDGQFLASGGFREVKIWKKANLTPLAFSVSAASEELLQAVQSKFKPKIIKHATSPDGKLLAIATEDGNLKIWDTVAKKVALEVKSDLKTSHEIQSLEFQSTALNLDINYHKAEIARIETQNKALDELLKKANDAIVAMNKVVPEKEKLLGPAEDARKNAQKVVDDLKAELAKTPDPSKEPKLKDAQDKLLTAITAENSARSAVNAAKSNIVDAEEDKKRITESKKDNATLVENANHAIAKTQAEQTKINSKIAELKKQPLNLKPAQLTFSHDQGYLYVQTEKGETFGWSVALGIPVDASFSPQWTVSKVLAGKDYPFTDRINALDFSPDGKTLASGGGELSRSGDLILIDVASGKVISSFKEVHKDSILGLDYSADGKFIATASADKIAKVFEATSGKQVFSFEGHTNYVNGVGFRTDGRILATAGADSMVFTWDLTTGERKNKITGWVKEVTSVSFVGATNQLLTSSGDNMVRIVTDTGGQVRTISGLPDFIQSAQANLSGQNFVAGGEDSYLRIWDGAGKELATFGPQKQ